MPASQQEMETLFSIVSRADSDQVHLINGALRQRLSAIDYEGTSRVRVGMRVTWVGKRGPQAGVVQRVKQRYVEVLADKTNVRWNVSAGLLREEAKP